MNKFAYVAVCAAIPISLFAQSLFAQNVAPPHTSLKVGDMAPDFTLPSTAGETVKLSDFRGRSAVVLAFFPAAFTGGCTKEMLAYQAGIGKFEGDDTRVFGISTDNTPSQAEFAKQLGLKFPLLSDFATRDVATRYGVLVPQRGYANRVTFVIDREGKIVHLEEGTSALDPAGAETACSRMAHREQ